MALREIRIGSMENIHVFDDADYDSSIETDWPIKAGTPVGPDDVVRLVDIGVTVGDVFGPAISVDSNIVEFNGVSGKSIKDGGLSHANVSDAITKKHTQGTDTALGALGTKNPPIDADKAIYRDSTAGDVLVTSTWTQIKAFLKTYFDGIYSALFDQDLNTTDDVEFNTVSLTGGQLVFPAIQVPSAGTNTLDDYEEGTYNPTLTCVTSGTITLNASYDTLAYTKVGRKVTITGSIVVSSVSSPLGALRMSLPFAIDNLSEISERFTGVIAYSGLVAIGAPGALVLYGNSGSSVGIIELTTTGMNDDVSNHIQAGTELCFGFSYFTS